GAERRQLSTVCFGPGAIVCGVLTKPHLARARRLGNSHSTFFECRVKALIRIIFHRSNLPMRILDSPRPNQYGRRGIGAAALARFDRTLADAKSWPTSRGKTVTTRNH